MKVFYIGHTICYICLICLMIKCMQVSTSKIVITWVLTNVCMEFLKYWWVCLNMCVMYSKMTNLKFTPIEKTLNWPAWDKASYTIHCTGFRFEKKSQVRKIELRISKSVGIIDLYFTFITDTMEIRMYADLCHPMSLEWFINRARVSLSFSPHPKFVLEESKLKIS